MNRWPPENCRPPADGADITAFALPQTGDYTVLAAGQNIRDRGPYSLTLIVAAGSVTPTQEVATAPLVTPARAPAAATPARAEEPLCTVVATGGLRLRGGPGQNYPVIGMLQANAQVRPRAAMPPAPGSRSSRSAPPNVGG